MSSSTTAAANRAIFRAFKLRGLSVKADAVAALVSGESMSGWGVWERGEGGGREDRDACARHDEGQGMFVLVMTVLLCVR
jgi:hypothetical protein